MCVITRMGFRSPRFVPGAIRDYRRLAALMDHVPAAGLLRSALLVENATTCYSVSIWSGEPIYSSQVEEHIRVVRRTFSRLACSPARGPELWSTTWRLVGTSNNLSWGDFDLQGAIDAAA